VVKAAQPDFTEAASALPFQPVVDGVVLPEPPLDAIRSGNASGVRLLTGTNRHEMTLFTLADPTVATIDDEGITARAPALLGDAAAGVTARYRADHPDLTGPELWLELATDGVFRIPAIRMLEAHREHGPGWLYLFTWETPVFGGVLKSSHALE